MRNTTKKFILAAAATVTVALPLTAHAADATSFDPTLVKVTAKPISSIPVGTIISWPVAQNPADMQNPDGSYNWLECNGQNFSQTVYPELFALLGGRVPDLRGLFLRGHGGDSAGLGTRQDESVYIAPGSAQISIASQIYVVKAGYPGTAGNHDRPAGVDVLAPANSSGGSGSFQIKGPMSITSSANETRPENQAVRYLIRARP